MNCIKCGVDFKLSDYQKRNSIYTCASCRKLYKKNYVITQESKEAKRKWQVKYKKKWHAKNKHKTQAHGKVFRAIRRGDIIRENCAFCNTIGEAHHEDYNKPYDILWLCRKHHRALHEEFKNEKD